MYKGWIIRTKEGKFGAENLATGDILLPNYSSWGLLKLIIYSHENMYGISNI